MFLITEGPAIYYVDPDAMELKGTISWFVDPLLVGRLDRFFDCVGPAIYASNRKI